MKIVLATGGFDPVHSGHISYLKAAKEMGDMLIVGLNSDEWLERKKGKCFMPWNERLAILNNLQMVDEVFTFMDDDDTAINFIKQVIAHYPNDQIIFVNGGDRKKGNTPEVEFATSIADTSPGFGFVWGVGGNDKQNSSSWILEEWKSPKTIRNWGYYRVLHEDGTGANLKTKVKELVVSPGKSLSLQKHQYRSEYWVVTQGVATLELEGQPRELGIHENVEIPSGWWHKLSNKTSTPVRIVEIQTGLKCEEEDIERAPLRK